jgi:hypothetical protein
MNAKVIDALPVGVDQCLRPFGFTCPSTRDRATCKCTCALARAGKCRDSYCGTMGLCVITMGRTYRPLISEENANPSDPNGRSGMASIRQWSKTCLSPNGTWIANARRSYFTRPGVNNLEWSIGLFLRGADGASEEELVCRLAGSPDADVSLAWLTETHLLLMVRGFVPTPIKVCQHGAIRLSILTCDK